MSNMLRRALIVASMTEEREWSQYVARRQNLYKEINRNWVEECFDDGNRLITVMLTLLVICGKASDMHLKKHLYSP